MFSQTIYTFFSFTLFFTIMPLIGGRKLEDSKLELQNKMVPALIMSYKVWPLV